MRPLLHLLREGILVNAEADRAHLCDGEAPVDHVLSPLVHDVGPLREPVGHVVAHSLFLLLSELANPPEVSPLGVVAGRLWGHCFVSLGVVLDDVSVGLGHLLVLGRGPHLIVGFREDVRGFVLVVELPSRVEELLHLVDEHVVVLLVHPRILDDEAAVVVQGFRHLLAILKRTVLLLEIALHVDDRDGLGE